MAAGWRRTTNDNLCFCERLSDESHSQKQRLCGAILPPSQKCKYKKKVGALYMPFAKRKATLAHQFIFFRSRYKK